MGNIQSIHLKTPLQYVCASGREKMVRYLLENGADPTIQDKTGRDAIGIAQQMDNINNESRRQGIIQIIQTHQKSSKSIHNDSSKISQPIPNSMHLIQSKVSNLAEINFSDEFIQCQDEKVFIHRMCYVLCPSLKQNILMNYDVNVVNTLRHFLYTNQLRSELSITDFIHLYELGIIIDIPQLSNRILKVISKVLNVKNFDQGFKKAFESEHNDETKMDSLIFLLQNFYLDNKSDIETSMKKMLNLVKSKTDILIGDDNYGKVIQFTKEKLWKSKEYKDITLVCLDDVKIECHKAIIGVSPLFSTFDRDRDPNHYLVDFKSKPLSMFLEILYTGQVSLKDVQDDVLFDLYHLCHQSDFKDLSQQIINALKSHVNEKNCSKILEFYFSAHLEDKEFLEKLQESMKSSNPSDLCFIYLTCREKNPNMLKQVIEWMTSRMNKDTSSEWLSALDESEIDDQILWEKLGTMMNPDTFHLWNIFQNKLAKERDRIDKLEKENARIDKIEKENAELLDRLAKLEKMFSTK